MLWLQYDTKSYCTYDNVNEMTLYYNMSIICHILCIYT